MAGWETIWSANGGLQPGQFFDALKPLPALVSLLQRNAESSFLGTNVLVPGCGRGYAPIEFAKFGFNAVGLDISPTAVQSAQSYYSGLKNESNLSISFQQGSFFDVEKDSYDVGYDYTFFCALEPEMREDWSTSWSNLLKENGILITAIFPIVPGKIGGPPFAVTLAMYKKHLEPKGFQLLEEPNTLTNEQAHEGRGDGKTVLAIWKKSTTKSEL